MERFNKTDERVNMPFKYSCFISYSKNRSDVMKLFLEQLKATLENYIFLYSVDKEVYIDTQRLGPGCHYNEALSNAICQSICMIVVYTPSYGEKEHLFCQREYMAMESLEDKRIQMLGGKIDNNGMIFPIIFRGDKADIPSNIKDRIQYCDFSKFTTASSHIKKNSKYVRDIEQIAMIISSYYKAFKERDINPCTGCESFSLPREEDIEPWEEKSKKTRSSFPGRGV